MSKTTSVKLVHYEQDLGFDLGRTKRPNVLEENFYWDADIFCRAGMATSDFTKGFLQLDLEVKVSLKEHLVGFARTRQYGANSIMRLAVALSTALKAFPTLYFNIGWVVNALTISSIQGTKAALANFFIYWKDRSLNIVSNAVLHYLIKTKVKGRGSKNVLSDDPEKSWLTDFEYDVLLQAVWDNYDNGLFETQNMLLHLLSMQYARRPIQLAQLKIGDFEEGEADAATGVSGRRIGFPGVKDRIAETGFRDSKVEVHPLADHLWDLFQIQRREIQSLYEATLRITLTEDELKKLPLFCTRSRIETAVSTLEKHYYLNWRNCLDSELFHMLPGSVTAILSWRTISRRKADSLVSSIRPPISHRTERPMVVGATRMRHTKARQLARLGMPRPVLSHWLGHTSEQSLQAYYSDPAEESRKLNEAMLPVLTPVALAFAGKLIDNESQATRGNDPASKLEFANNGRLKDVGNCGKHSFCATTSVPIPCYRCKHFEPLVDAPHNEVLVALQQRQAEEASMIKIGGQRNLLMPIDLTADIRAVLSCITHCNARKAELGRI